MDGSHLQFEKPGRQLDVQRRRLRRQLTTAAVRRLLPILLVVFLPTALVTLYFAVYAAPQYVSSAKFVVRGQGSSSTGMLSSLLQTAGSSPASEDTYAVQDYIMSRDAAKRMMGTQKLLEAFEVPEADAISRFPGPLFGKSFEHFYRYYQDHVVADLDSTTGISTLTVRTFRPQDSNRIATALLLASEQLVNRMNERQRSNTIKSSSKEVTEAEDELRRLGVRIADYRSREAMIDPLKQSVSMLHDVGDLQGALTTTRLQMAQIQASTPNSPLIPVFRRKEEALQAQIARSQQDITGADGSLVPKITTYDSLTIEKELAEKELEAARTALDTAIAQADRQSIYLDEIVEPDLPDYPTFPHSLASIAVVFASLLGIYMLGKLILVGAREHRLH